MQGESQAIMRVAPAPAGGNKINRNFDITPAVDGSAEWVVPGMGSQQMGCWVTLTNYSTANIRFNSGDALTIVNAAATDSVLVPGATQDYWLQSGLDRLRFIGAATPGVSAHRSSV